MVPLLLVSATSAQGGAALAKSLFPALGPAGATGVRVALAAILLVAVFRPPFRSFERSQWAALIPWGLALGWMNLAFYQALERIPLGLAVTLEFTGPLGVAVLGSRRPIDFAWVLLAAAGIALLSPIGAAALDPLGMALALCAGLCWAIYILVGGTVARRIRHDGHGAAAGMCVSALAVLPFAAPSMAAADWKPSLVGVGLGVAALSSALPYSLELVALRRLPSRTFGILMSLEPAIAALTGTIFLGEALGPLQWLAVACVSLASAGATMSAPRAAVAEGGEPPRGRVAIAREPEPGDRVVDSLGWRAARRDIPPCGRSSRRSG